MIAEPRARKRGYTRKKIRALYTYTAHTQRPTVFGLITTDGRSMFRQYDKFDMHAFAKFIRAAVRKFGKICLILDKAPQHRAKMIRRLADEIDGLTLKFLPTATPEISAMRHIGRISSARRWMCHMPIWACYAKPLPNTQDTQNRISMLKRFCKEAFERECDPTQHVAGVSCTQDAIHNLKRRTCRPNST